MKTLTQNQNVTTRETAVINAASLFILGWVGLCAATHAASIDATVIAREGTSLPGTGGDPVAVLKAPFANDLGDLFVGGTLEIDGDQVGFIWTQPDQVPFLGSDIPGGAFVSGRGAASNSGDWMVLTYSQEKHQMRSGSRVVAEIDEIIQGTTASHQVKQFRQPAMTADGIGFFRVELKNLDAGSTRWGVMRAEDDGAAEPTLEIDPDSYIDGYPQKGLGVVGFGVSDNGVHQALAVQLGDKGAVSSALAIDGQVVAIKGGRTGRPNDEKWNSFGRPSVHSDGTYLGSITVKVGASFSEALAYSPSSAIGGPRVALAEGDCAGISGGATPCVTLEEGGYFKAAALDTASSDDSHPLAYVWVNPFGGPAAGAEYLVYACGAGNAARSHLLLSRGDTLDLDGDGTDDGFIDRVGIAGQPDIAFGDSDLWVGADLVLNSETLYSILRLTKPDCDKVRW